MAVKDVPGSFLDRLRYRDLIVPCWLSTLAIYEMENGDTKKARTAIALAGRKLILSAQRPLPLTLIALVGALLMLQLPPQISFWKLHVPLAMPLPASFLETLWEVQASLLALTLAVTVFAFGVVLSSGSGLRLDEFEEETGFLRAFIVGIVSLVVNGLVVSGFGNEAPTGFPGTAVVLLASLAVWFLVRLVFRARHAVNPEALLASRRKSLLRETAAAGFYERLNQRLKELFDKCCIEANVSMASGSHVAAVEYPNRVFSDRLGYVVDVDSRLIRPRRARFRRADIPHGDSSDDAQTRRPVACAKPVVLAFVPGQKVDRGDLLFAGAFPSSERRRWTLDSVAIDPVSLGGHLAQEAERWRALADRALTVYDLRLYEQVIDGFEEALIASAVKGGSSTPYNVDSQETHDTDFNESSNILVGQLRLALVTALASNGELMARSASAATPRIALRAYRAGRHELSRSMLVIVPGLYEAALSSGSQRTRELARGHLNTGLISFARELSMWLEDLELEVDSRKEAIRYLSDGFATICELAKAQLETADAANLKDLVNEWTQLFVYHEDNRLDEKHGWTLETEYSQDNTDILEEIANLVRMRQVGTFALAGWGLEIALRTDIDTEFTECLEYLLSLEEQADRIVNTCKRCLDYEFDEELDYGDWDLRKAANLEVVVTSSSYNHVRTLLATIAYMTVRGAMAPTIPPTAWLGWQHEAIERAASELKENGPLLSLLKAGEDEATIAVDNAAESLHLAGRSGRAAQHRRVREKPLDEQRVQQLKRDSREGWESERILPSLFSSFGTYRSVREERARAKPLKRTTELSKDMLTYASRIPLGHEQGLRHGRAVSREEMQVFWEHMQATVPKQRLALRAWSRTRQMLDREFKQASGVKSATEPPAAARLRGHIEQALYELKGRGYSPSVVLLPAQLTFGVVFDPKGEATRRLNVPLEPGTLGAAAGEVCGVPVLTVMGPRGREDFCCVIDLGHLGEWRQVDFDSQGTLLKISISEQTPEHASTDMVTPDSETEHDAREAWTQNADDTPMVLLELEEKFRLKIRDKSAVVWIVPPQRMGSQAQR